MLRSGNPTLKAFERPQTWAELDAAQAKSRTMTIEGTVNAAFILVGLCAASAVGTWMFLTSGSNLNMGYGALIGSMLIGLVLSLIISFSPRSAPFLGPVYALVEGVFVGALSLVVATFVSKGGPAAGPETGIIFQAMLLTFGIFGSLLIGFKAGLIRIGTTMKRVMVAALGGVLLFFIAGIVLRLVGVSVPFFYEMFGWGKSGWIGIGFSVFMLILGSLFLVWDFQTIEEGAQAGAPKYMEWYGAFSLLVTLVWIYVEALRLLAKLKGRE
ncbi:MAG: Bax inhibitor-1/YccA family protein [Phycisphaeraceae bacterium]|nr:Bax inhibitor-1/YccA family protein [Phycisphaeraceae bacterium]